MASAAATWLWLPPGDPAPMISFLQRHSVREVFVGVPWAGPDPEVVAAATALRAAGFVVRCLGGDPQWAEIPVQAGKWAARAMTSGLFTGIHLDIEPWTLSTWRGREDQLLTGVVNAIESVRQVADGRPVDVDLPAWLAVDHPVGYSAIARAADRVTILAYRDRAAHILAFAAAARGLARAAGRDYRIAVETRPGVELHTTFADDGIEVLRRELSTLQAAVAGDPACRGLAVHDGAGWRALAGARPSTGSGDVWTGSGDV